MSVFPLGVYLIWHKEIVSHAEISLATVRVPWYAYSMNKLSIFKVQVGQTITMRGFTGTVARIEDVRMFRKARRIVTFEGGHRMVGTGFTYVEVS